MSEFTIREAKVLDFTGTVRLIDTAQFISSFYVENLEVFFDIFNLGKIRPDPNDPSDPNAALFQNPTAIKDAILTQNDTDPDAFARRMEDSIVNLISVFVLGGTDADGRVHHLTASMSNALDILLRSLRVVGINPEVPSTISKQQILEWKELADKTTIIQQVLEAAQGAAVTANSFQAMVELIYINTGNEILTEQLDDLEQSFDLNKQALDLLTQFQDFKNAMEIPVPIPPDIDDPFALSPGTQSGIDFLEGDQQHFQTKIKDGVEVKDDKVLKIDEDAKRHLQIFEEFMEPYFKKSIAPQMDFDANVIGGKDTTEITDLGVLNNELENEIPQKIQDSLNIEEPIGSNGTTKTEYTVNGFVLDGKSEIVIAKNISDFTDLRKKLDELIPKLEEVTPPEDQANENSLLSRLKAIQKDLIDIEKSVEMAFGLTGGIDASLFLFNVTFPSDPILDEERISEFFQLGNFPELNTLIGEQKAKELIQTIILEAWIIDSADDADPIQFVSSSNFNITFKADREFSTVLTAEKKFDGTFDDPFTGLLSPTSPFSPTKELLILNTMNQLVDGAGDVQGTFDPATNEVDGFSIQDIDKFRIIKEITFEVLEVNPSDNTLSILAVDTGTGLTIKLDEVTRDQTTDEVTQITLKTTSEKKAVDINGNIILAGAKGAVSPNFGRSGDFQKNLTTAIVSGEALNDKKKEELRRFLFIFEEYYKSAAALLNKMTQLIEKIAQGIAR